MNQNKKRTSPPYPSLSSKNPGQTLAVVSLVMVVVCPIVGIILAVMSRNKSRAAGKPTKLGTTGLALNLAATAVGLIIAIFTFLVIIPSAASASIGSTLGLSTQHNSLTKQANEVARRAEAYKTQAGDYPKSTTDFDQYSVSVLPNTIKVYSSLLLTSTSLTYIYCGQSSAQIVYLGNSQDDKHITSLGSASDTEVCPKSY